MENKQNQPVKEKCNCGQCWQCRGFFGTKTNGIFLLILIVLMVIAIIIMLGDKQKYFPVRQDVVEEVVQDNTEMVDEQQESEDISNKVVALKKIMNFYGRSNGIKISQCSSKVYSNYYTVEMHLVADVPTDYFSSDGEKIASCGMMRGSTSEPHPICPDSKLFCNTVYESQYDVNSDSLKIINDKYNLGK